MWPPLLSHQVSDKFVPYHGILMSCMVDVIVQIYYSTDVEQFIQTFLPIHYHYLLMCYWYNSPFHMWPPLLSHQVSDKFAPLREATPIIRTLFSF
jgi:hypothetical protein